MACIYTYKGKQYSEQEIKDIVFKEKVNPEDIKFATLDDIANILAYSNSKIILDGWKIEYSTPLGNKYDTLEEVNNEIRDLASSDTEVDLSGVKINPQNKIDKFNNNKEVDKVYSDYIQEPGFNFHEVTIYYKDGSIKKYDYDSLSKEQYNFYRDIEFDKNNINNFIQKNKEYEQSKEIIEQWKKENNIQYDPEEVYSRGQGFYSSIGAYSNLELDLLLKNLIQHIEDNKKAGGEFTISAFTKPIDKRLKHIEGTGDRVRFVIYPQSEHIKWAAPTDVYSGSVWDAHEKVSKDKKSELLGVSFTKAPSLRNINEVSPNLADIIDNLSHAHNELGIELTTNNFRIEYDDNIDYSTKKLIDNINKILDDKYGKLEKPEINSTNKKELKYSLEVDAQKQGIFNTKEEAERIGKLAEETGVDYLIKEVYVQQGKQPTQTKENTTSIESVKNKVLKKNFISHEVINTDRIKWLEDKATNNKYEENENNRWEKIEGRWFKVKEFGQNQILPIYENQALINLKIAALKEVARKYPRSLITSKVVPINPNVVDNSEIQYSKVENIQDLQNEINQLKQELERVEKEGFGALKPIYNFYENTVTNILKKQGYSPTLITDEYGNTWNEIKIEKQEKIFLSSVLSASDILTEDQLKIFKRLQDNRLISKKASPFDSNGKKLYSIPKIETETGWIKDYNKKQFLDNYIKANNISFLRTRETYNSILVEIGNFEPFKSENYTSTISTPSSTITKNKVLKFLKDIGFTNIQYVSKLSYKGQQIEGNAYVDLMEKVMQVVEGKENITLPEEAMHILVELIKTSNLDLYKKMNKEIVDFQLYRDVFNDPSYNTNNFYKNSNGSLNIEKIKDEAIAKLLAEYLIGQIDEKPVKTQRVRDYWVMIKNWIRNIFGKYKNPFKEAIDLIDNDFDISSLSNENLFLSATENPNKNKDIFDNIKNSAKNKGFYKIDDVYYKDGEKWNGKRVSNLKDEYYKNLFKNKPLDETEKPYFEQYALDGKIVHSLFEEAYKNMIDENTGLKKEEEKLNTNLSNSPLERRIYIRISNYVRNLINSYPDGTRFISEQIIYDSNKDLIGTVDFIAINKNGTVDIYDWKTTKDLEELKDYKKKGYSIQLESYQNILKDSYNISEFGKLRAIPITRVATKDGDNYKIFDVNIGAVEANLIKDKNLRPIISEKESTGDPYKDDLIKKLRNIYNKFINIFRQEKSFNRKVLNDLSDAIYELQTSSSISNFVNYLKDVEGIIKKINNSINTEKDLSKEEISDFLDQISLYEDIANSLSKFDAFILDESIDVDQRKYLSNALSRIRITLDSLSTKREKILDKYGKEIKVFGLTLPEKVINGATKLFRVMGSQSVASVRFLYEITKKAYNKANLETDNELSKLKELRSLFDNYIKSKNISNKEGISKIVDFQKGTLHSKINKDFYKTRLEVLESRNPDIIKNFVKKNYNYNNYLEWYSNELKEQVDFWKSQVYDPLDKSNDEKIRKLKLLNFEKSYNLEKYPLTAFNSNNKLIWSKNIIEDNWLSEEYKDIKDTPLLEIYEFFLKKNRELFEIGAIDEFKIYTFLPNVRKSIGDILMKNDSDLLKSLPQIGTQMYNNWKNSLLVSDYEYNYSGDFDEITGEKLNRRFVQYTKSLPKEDISFDIFTIYGLMSQEIAKEKYLQENDEIVRALSIIEKNKYTIDTNKFGTVVKEDGKPKLSTQPGLNSELFEKYKKAIYEGETLQVDADYSIPLRFKEFWNNSALSKIKKFNLEDGYKPSRMSLTKLVLWLDRINQKRILGVNIASGLSNLFGSSFSADKLYKKYITNDDLNKAWLKMTSCAFYQNDDMKKNAALVDYFLPLLNNREDFKSKQLSLNKAVKILSQDWLMYPQRKSEEIVQLNIFFAVLDNTGLINGELVSLREKAMQELNYNSRFSLTKDEREKLESSLENKVSELKKEYGLVQKSKIVKKENDVFIEIPGVSRDSQTVENLRNLIRRISQDATGSMNEFNNATYRYNIGWRLFMTFKNWIPRQADVRFGEFHYSQEHNAYEYGRVRMFVKSLSATWLNSLKLIPIPYVTGKLTSKIGQDEFIQKAKDDYQKKVNAAKELNQYNEETFITENEFIEMWLQAVESQFAEFRMFTLLLSAVIFGLAAPDDDDSAEEKGFKKIVRKQIDKTLDEVGFFYNPKSGVDIFGQTAPVMGFIKDTYYLFDNTTRQFFGFTLENIGFEESGEKMQIKAKPLKYSFKVLPFMKEVLNYIPIIDADMAREWGINLQDKRGF